MNDFIDEKKPKPLPSTLRSRRRYIAYQVISEEKVLLADITNTIWHSVLNFLGEHGTSETDMWIARDTYNEETQTGLIRCSHDSVEKIRASLALIQRIGDARVVFKVLGISGTMNAAKMKFFGETRLTEFT
ncbi:MAG: ribonuclease P protein component 2 [Candidatus Aenigmarchaeota archaeon]|nr:ribonuclease P protein component 2 [Candidatus Aenigmarchaeota archaeon]